MALRRLRGSVLRLVRRRPLALAVGFALAAPSALVEFSGRYGEWWIDGLALIVGATGLAIFWTGLTGAAPDWIEEDGKTKDGKTQDGKTQDGKTQGGTTQGGKT